MSMIPIMRLKCDNCGATHDLMGVKPKNIDRKIAEIGWEEIGDIDSDGCAQYCKKCLSLTHDDLMKLARSMNE